MTARDKDQAKRFEEMANEVGADASGEEFERVFGKVVPPKRRPPDEKSQKRLSRKRGDA